MDTISHWYDKVFHYRTAGGNPRPQFWSTIMNVLKDDHRFFINMIDRRNYQILERLLDYPDGKVIGIYNTKKSVFEAYKVCISHV